MSMQQHIQQTVVGMSNVIPVMTAPQQALNQIGVTPAPPPPLHISQLPPSPIPPSQLQQMQASLQQQMQQQQQPLPQSFTPSKSAQLLAGDSAAAVRAVEELAPVCANSLPVEPRYLSSVKEYFTDEERRNAPRCLGELVDKTYAHVLEHCPRHLFSWAVVARVLKEVLVTRAGIAGNCAKLAMFLEPKKLASSCYHRTWRARRENLQHTSQDKDGDDEPPSGSELDMNRKRSRDSTDVASPEPPTKFRRYSTESAPVVPGVPPMQTPPPPGVVLSSADSIRLEPVVDSEPQLQAAVSGVSPPDTSSQDSSQQNEADNTAAIAHDIAMAYKVMNTAFFPDSVEFFKHSSAFGSSTPASIVEEVLAVRTYCVAHGISFSRRLWPLVCMVLKEVLTLGGVPESPYLSKFLDPAKLINKFYNMKAQLKSPKKKTPKPEPPTPVPLVDLSSPTKCHNCHAAEATLVCFVCNRLCSKCSKSIHRLPALKDHQIVTLAEFREEANCTVHVDRPLTFVCTQDGALVCEKCLLGGAHSFPDGSPHPFTPIQKAAQLQLQLLEEEEKLIQDKVQRCRDWQKQNFVVNTELYLPTVTKQIVDSFEQIIAIATGRKEQLLNTLQSLASKTESDIATLSHALVVTSAALDEIQRLKKLTGAELIKQVKLADHVREKAKQVGIPTELPVKPTEAPKISFSIDIHEILEKIQIAGQILREQQPNSQSGLPVS